MEELHRNKRNVASFTEASSLDSEFNSLVKKLDSMRCVVCLGLDFDRSDRCMSCTRSNMHRPLRDASTSQYGAFQGTAKGIFNADALFSSPHIQEQRYNVTLEPSSLRAGFALDERVLHMQDAEGYKRHCLEQLAHKLGYDLIKKMMTMPAGFPLEISLELQVEKDEMRCVQHCLADLRIKGVTRMYSAHTSGPPLRIEEMFLGEGQSLQPKPEVPKSTVVKTKLPPKTKIVKPLTSEQTPVPYESPIARTEDPTPNAQAEFVPEGEGQFSADESAGVQAPESDVPEPPAV